MNYFKFHSSYHIPSTLHRPAKACQYYDDLYGHTVLVWEDIKIDSSKKNFVSGSHGYEFVFQ
jgi:hypothetical protein